MGAIERINHINERRAKLVLFKAGHIKSGHVCRYYGCVGGDHRFMIGGNYYSVDLVLGKAWRTA